MDDRRFDRQHRRALASLVRLICVMAVAVPASLLYSSAALASSGLPSSVGASALSPAVVPSKSIDQYLGAAGPSGEGAPWTMIALGSLTANGPGTDFGNVAVGGKASLDHPFEIQGKLFLGAGGSVSGNVTPSGGTETNAALVSAAVSAATNAESEFAALTANQNFGNLGNQTVTGGSGFNVIDASEVSMSNGSLTLSGNANSVFVINVSGNFSTSNSDVVLSGGVLPQNVVFNIGGSLTITGGGGETYFGTILVKGSATVHDKILEGELIAQEITDTSGFRVKSFPPAPVSQTISGHIYSCQGGVATTTEVTGGKLAVTAGPTMIAAQSNPLEPVKVPAGSYTMEAASPAGFKLVACNGTTGGSTQTVTVPAGGEGVGIFYVAAVTQTISGHIYSCQGGVATTTEVSGGKLAVTAGPTMIAAQSNPLEPVKVPAGSYTMEAASPAGFKLVACNGTTGGSTQTVTVPAGGEGVGIFYVAAVTQTISGHIYSCQGGVATTTEVSGGKLAVTAGPTTIASQSNPLEPVKVPAGSYTMEAASPAGFKLVACNGTTGGSTQTVTVPAGGEGVGIFYVAKPSEGFEVIKKQRFANSGEEFTTAKLKGKAPKTVEYEIIVKNTGEASLAVEKVTDANVPACDRAPGLKTPLASNEEAVESTCSKEYPNAGTFTNVAIVEGNKKPKESPPVEVELEKPSEGFEVIKMQRFAGEPTYTTKKLVGKVPKTVEYEIIVKNTGEASLAVEKVSDANVPACDRAPGLKTPLASKEEAVESTCSIEYTTAGTFTNVAVVEGNKQPKPSNEVEVELGSPSEGFEVIKKQRFVNTGEEFTTAKLKGKAPKTVEYEIIVKNTGEASLAVEKVSDANVPACDRAPGLRTPLASKEEAVESTCSKEYPNAGTFTNVAVVEGNKKPKESPPVEVELEKPSEGFEVIKKQRFANTGEAFTTAKLEAKATPATVEYEIIVKNTGEASLAVEKVSDANVPACDRAPGLQTPLVSGQEAVESTCSMEYTKAGTYKNVAIVEGNKTPKESPPVEAVLPGQLVKAECTVSESGVHLVGATGSKRNTFTVRISALGVKEITFYIDNKKYKTLKSSQARNGQFAVKINPKKLGYGPHRVSVRTIMTEPACAKLARSSVFVRPKPPQVTPKFTG